MSAWLTVPQALALIELESGDTNENGFKGALDAACEYVEGKRAELLIGDPPVFTPGPTVKLGTAMLANRWYQRRGSPLGAAQYSEFGGGTILRYDPDIAKLLGIGTDGGFIFGAGVAIVAPVVEVP